MRKQLSSWQERLNRYVSVVTQETALDQARERFIREAGLSAQESVNPQWTVHFFNWFVFDDQTNGPTLFERFLQHEGRRMEGDLKEALQSLVLDAYQLEEIGAEVLTVRHLSTGNLHYIVDAKDLAIEPGQILLGRLLNMGARDLLYPGSLILQAQFKQPLLALLKDENTRGARTLALYRLILETRIETDAAGDQDSLIRNVYSCPQPDDLRKQLGSLAAFELKMQDEDEEIWVYAPHKEEYLFSELNNTLLALHEVSAELLLTGGQLILEGFAPDVEAAAEQLQLPRPLEETAIQRLTSTNLRLTRGTVFITSQPTLPQKVLMWAVRKYFAEKWLVTPAAGLDGLAPLQAAASDAPAMKEKLLALVQKVESDGAKGQGPGRFMEIGMIRPRLHLPSKTVHLADLLTRPLLKGLPESTYTVHPELLKDITRFVAEMTEGKSEATVRKYDEVMSLFRSFVRSAFGPAFEWSSLQPGEVAYFLVHDIYERVDVPTKTLAANLLSVLAAFFKWVDKQQNTALYSKMQPLLTEMKDDLAEAYRQRTILQKEAVRHLQDQQMEPQEAAEEQLLLVAKQDSGWLVRRSGSQEISLHFDRPDELCLGQDWMLSGLIGQMEDGEWRLFGTPELYPPAVSRLLGVGGGVLV
jgi:hypothetical protein